MAHVFEVSGTAGTDVFVDDAKGTSTRATKRKKLHERKCQQDFIPKC
jgi:hypothetical protein